MVISWRRKSSRRLPGRKNALFPDKISFSLLVFFPEFITSSARLENGVSVEKKREEENGMTREHCKNDLRGQGESSLEGAKCHRNHFLIDNLPHCEVVSFHLFSYPLKFEQSESGVTIIYDDYDLSRKLGETFFLSFLIKDSSKFAFSRGSCILPEIWLTSSSPVPEMGIAK